MGDNTFFDNNKNKLYEEFPDIIIDINEKVKRKDIDEDCH